MIAIKKIKVATINLILFNKQNGSFLLMVASKFYSLFSKDSTLEVEVCKKSLSH